MLITIHMFTNMPDYMKSQLNLMSLNEGNVVVWVKVRTNCSEVARTPHAPGTYLWISWVLSFVVSHCNKSQYNLRLMYSPCGQLSGWLQTTPNTLVRLPMFRVIPPIDYTLPPPLYCSPRILSWLVARTRHQILFSAQHVLCFSTGSQFWVWCHPCWKRLGFSVPLISHTFAKNIKPWWNASYHFASLFVCKVGF